MSYPKTNFITDRLGEKYKVEIDDDLSGPIFKIVVANAKLQPSPVGYANCLKESDGVLMLADLQIRDDAVLITRRTGLFGMFQKVKRETVSLQQRGLGTELLKCVFAFAKEKDFRRIWGKVKDLDYPKNPNLLKWYADMGFMVTIEPKQSAAIALISKDL